MWTIKLQRLNKFTELQTRVEPTRAFSNLEKLVIETTQNQGEQEECLSGNQTSGWDPFCEVWELQDVSWQILKFFSDQFFFS